MKRILASILLVVTLCLSCMSIASCGGGGNGGTLTEFAVPENGYDGSDVTITFYHTMGANLRKVLEEAIADFNQIYPNIHIEHEQTGSYDDVRDTIKTEIAVGAQPNLAYCYPDHVALYNLAKAVVKLDDLIASEITVTGADGSTDTLGFTADEIADFIPGYYEEGKQYDEAGTMYTLPLSKSTEVLYYDVDFFEANNLSVPTTWDEMEALCKKIKEIDSESIPLGYDSESNWFITMTEQLGSDYTSATGEHFIFDNDTNYKFVERFRGWYQAGYVTTQELNGGNYSSKLFTATTGTRCYMSIGSSAGASHQVPGKDEATNDYPFEVGIATIPQINPEDPQVISQGPSLCIFNKSNPQEVVASWLFAKFLATDVKFQADFSMVSGYVPAIKSVDQDPVYAEFLESSKAANVSISDKAATVYTYNADLATLTTTFKSNAFAFAKADANSIGFARTSKDGNTYAQLIAADGTAVTAPEAGTEYKLAFTNSGKTYYFTGAYESKYFATTTDAAKAKAVYLEAVDGGYNMYFNNTAKDKDGNDITVKKYVNAVSAGNDYLTAIAAQVCLDQADAYYTSPAFNGSSTARDQVGILIQNCFSQTPQGNETVADMIKRLFNDAVEECEYQHPN